MAAYTPALEKALKFLELYFSDRPSSGRGPATQTLAELGDVSYVTMWKARKIFNAQGPRGAWVGAPKKSRANAHSQAVASPENAGEAESPVRGVKWERVRLRLQQDILTGRFAYGSALPSLRDLAMLYAVSQRTLRRALDSLSEDGILAPRARAYEVVRPRIPRSGSFIALIGLGNPLGEVRTLNSRHSDFVGALELECVRNHIRLHSRGFNRGDLNVMLDIFDLESGPEGIVFWLGEWMQIPELRGNFTEFMQRLLRKGKPVVLIDEMGEFQPSELGGSHHRLQVFHIAGKAAGRAVGRSLLELGHHKVAYLSHLHRQEWSHRRLAGLKEAFANAGLAEGIIPVTVEDLYLNPIRTPDFLSLFRSGDPWENEGRLEGIAPQSPGLAPEGQGKSPLLRFLNPESLRWLRFAIAGETNAIRRPYMWDCYNRIRDSVFTYACFEQLHAHGSVLFEPASALKGVTAWVCCNDLLARAAHEWQQTQSRGRYREKLIVGFDNFADYYGLGLSTYEFDFKGLAPKAIAFLLNTESYYRMPRRQVTEMEGMVFLRGKTALLKGSKSNK